MLVTLFAGALIGSVSLTYPFGRDQGIYAYIAKLILNGKIDYKFAYNLRQPAIHYTFVLGQLIFGESMLNMRIFDIIWQSLTGFVIFIITYRLTGSKISSFASVFLYLLLYFRQDFWHTMQTEGFMNLPFALCVLMLMSKNVKNMLQFLSGVMFSVVFLYKFIVFPFILLLLVFTLFSYRENFRARLKSFLYFLAGFTIILFIVLFYYYINNSLNEMLEIQFVQIPEYGKIGMETESPSLIISNIIRLFSYSVYTPLIMLTAVYFILIYRNKKAAKEHVIILMWLITALFCLIAQMRFFYYHFLIIIPPIAIGSACLYTFLRSKYSLKNSKLINIGATVFLIIFMLMASKPYYSRIADTYNLFTGKSSIKDLYFQNGTTTDSVFTINKIYAVSDFVRQNTIQSDGIYLWGIEPLIYYLSGRDCVLRFIYNTPLCWKSVKAEYLKEFITEIKRNNPKLIIVAKSDPLFIITGFHDDSEQLLKNFPEFKKIIDDSYFLKKDFIEFKIYELTKPFNN